jgi:hypothetical protein
MPDPDYQLEMQWEMRRRAQEEAQREAQWKARLRAMGEARRAVGFDLVRPLQDQAQPIPPDVISGRARSSSE